MSNFTYFVLAMVFNHPIKIVLVLSVIALGVIYV
jgi:hypothetical protein